ncbi:WD repeat-containing protein 55 [Glycine soja]
MEINLGKLAFDIDFHPSDNLVAAGLITGHLHLYRYSPDTVPVRLLEVHAHTESCRAARFINSGRGSSDCSILATDVETGSTIARVDNAHESAVNRLINLTESTVVSGDNDGCIKAQARSEFSEDELLSVVLMKNGRKVVCGSQTGIILLYSWGCFKDCSDQFTDLSSNSIDAMLKLNEDRIITGSENRIINLYVDSIVLSLNSFCSFPVLSINSIVFILTYGFFGLVAFSHDRKFLGSIAYDQMLKALIMLVIVNPYLVITLFSSSRTITLNIKKTLKVFGIFQQRAYIECYGTWIIYCKVQETKTNSSGVIDSDDDEMDLDGNKRNNGHAVGCSNKFFVDL